jgi:RNA polymerase sigma-70 factor (ECF subfamily)
MEVAAKARMPSRAPEADLELIERHRVGDPAAFDEIFHQYEQMVFNVALRMSGDREDAADLSQEIFLRVYRHIGRFRGRSSLKTWIYRVALNCCRSRLSRRRLPVLSTPDLANNALARIRDRRAGPERVAIGRDRARQLFEALQTLPRVYREAVVLRDVEELAYNEISAVLGVRLGTVRSRIARGRDRLRRALEEEE